MIELEPEVRQELIRALGRARQAEMDMDAAATDSLDPDIVMECYRQIQAFRKCQLSLMEDLGMEEEENG